MTEPPIVQLTNVTRSFPGPPEVQALKAINLRIDKGEYVSIVGPSGSGKSTMLNVLGLLDRPSVGEYYLDGELTQLASEDERAALRGGKRFHQGPASVARPLRTARCL